jgi:hypothetical protein
MLTSSLKPLAPLQSEPDSIVEALFYPFLRLAYELIDQLIDIMFNTPDIHPNPSISEVHQLSLMIAVPLSVLVLALGGISMMVHRESEKTYGEIRQAVPRLILGLGFSMIALPVLQYGAEFSNAFVHAFRPQQPALALEQLAGLTTSLVLVWLINSWLLLGLALVFLIRATYLAFIAAISPLLAVTWALPYSRPYAESFISGWFALLAVAPLDILVLRFSMTMLQGSEAFGLQPVSNWLIGVASFALMLWLPYQLWGVSQSMVGRSANLGTSVGDSVDRGSGGDGSGGSDDDEDRRQRRERRRRDRDRRRRR